MKGLRILLMLVLGTGLAQTANAHRFAPSLLKVNEIAEQQYNMVWKTPAQGVSNIPLRPAVAGVLRSEECQSAAAGGHRQSQ